MDPDRQKLEEIYRLERDNNRMLRSMRRNAFWGGVVKAIMWLIALGVPIWLYLQYLAPALQQFNDVSKKVYGTSVQISDPSTWTALFKEFEKKFSSASTSR